MTESGHAPAVQHRRKEMIAYFLGLLALSFVSGAVGYIIRGEVDRKRVWALQ